VEVTGGGSSEAAVNVVLAKEEKLESKEGRHLQQAYRRKLFALSVAYPFSLHFLTIGYHYFLYFLLEAFFLVKSSLRRLLWKAGNQVLGFKARGVFTMLYL
jgi:hypothetical protein